MCTVTYTPAGTKVLLTSNRDEKYTRLPATPPSFYTNNQNTLVYPADTEKGGTWIAMKDTGEAAVLLNGAFRKHRPAPSYQRSRGLILLDVLSNERPSDFLNTLLLKDVEPFTLVLFENNSLSEMRWDGHKKNHRQLPASKAHIWSSVTLYDELIADKRARWFATFVADHPAPTQQDLLQFHQNAGECDSHCDLLMNRDNIYNTVSTTSILLGKDSGSMIYIDHGKKKITEINLELTRTTMRLC